MAEISKLGRSLVKSSMTRPLNETKFVHQDAHIRPSGHTWSRIKTSRLARVLSSPTGIGPVHPSPTGIGPVYPCRSMESCSSVEILNGRSNGEPRSSQCQGQQERGPPNPSSTPSFTSLPEGERVWRYNNRLVKNLMQLQEENRLQEVNIYFTIIISLFTKILPPYEIINLGDVCCYR